MNKDERQRLEKLQKSYHKAEMGSAYIGEKLSPFDLHLLLAEDEHTRRLIQAICKKALKAALKTAQEEDAPDAAQSDDEQDETDDRAATTAPIPVPDLRNELAQAQADKQGLTNDLRTTQQQLQRLQTEHADLERRLRQAQRTPPPPPKEVLREQLAAELTLLNAVKADAELAAKWLRLDADENEARQLVRLLAVIGHWDEVQDLWSLLAERCKHHQRAATLTERGILNAALSLHNLRYRDRAAQTVGVEIGVPFDPKQMERATAKGSTVTAVWWPGLENAAGQLQKRTLVATQ